MRILVAEDDPVIALGLVKRLRSLGHEPLGPAANGVEAVAQATNDPPDLYLFDIDRPLLDGLAAARALAEAGLRRPVVVVTGVQDPGLIERSIETGVSAYLTKPIDERQLGAAIQLAAARHDEFVRLEAEVTRAQQRSRTESSSSGRRESSWTVLDSQRRRRFAGSNGWPAIATSAWQTSQPYSSTTRRCFRQISLSVVLARHRRFHLP
jgi:AmiR/NasT family two-component response regulator